MASIQEDLLFLSLAEKISEEPYEEDSILCEDKYCTLHNHKAVIKTIKLNKDLNHSVRSNHKTNDNKSLKIINSSRSVLNTDSSFRYDYKSGAIYDGKIRDNLKFGNGTFLWPNGDKYVGEFKANCRHGFGKQLWDDGSSYEGFFYEDRRSGKGVHISVNGDKYEGDWYFDYRHGHGKYLWKDLNIYEGMFFMNNREGYGTLIYSTGDIFVGLYKKDNRFGPGSLKYPNNREDVGFWIGDKLIRLIVSINVNFTFKDLDEIDKKIELKSWYDRECLLEEILNPQNMFLNKLNKVRDNAFIKNDPYIDKLLEKNIAFYDQYLNSFDTLLKGENENIDFFKKNQIIKVENITPTLLEILKYYRRFKVYHNNLRRSVNFDMVNFENEKRDSFSSPGILETCSIELLNACNQEDLDKIKELKNHVNLDVCDNRGYNSFIISVLKCNKDIINYLLDNGANINHLLDNGLSALMICMIRYYTNDKFLPNTALKHQDLTITRKLNPDSKVVPNDDELSRIRRLFKSSSLFDESEDFNMCENNLDDFRLFIRVYDNDDETKTIEGESTKASEFESEKSIIRYKLNVNQNMIDKYVDIMSKNENLNENDNNQSNILKRTNQLHFLNEVSEVIELLLRRGADPSLSSIPYPALCFAVASGDIKIVRLLLEKGADCNKRMPKKYSSLTPLCLACGVLGDSGPEIVKLLLDCLADPNASADIGQEYLSMCEPGWQNEVISDEINDLIVGRTPLHIACARNDSNSAKVIKLLLEHSANPNLICNGQSPLSLAIACGNKEAIDLLLKSNRCDPNLPLSNGVGSALCAIGSTLYEHNWLPHERIKLIDKLIHYGADILQPIAFGPRRYVGTVVDYAYYMYNSDQRLAHTPYHSLTINERNTYNARKNLLNHFGNKCREKALERAHLLRSGIDKFPPIKKLWGPAIRRTKIVENDYTSDGESQIKNERKLLKYCYSCGRSVAVKLIPCSRCKKVFYCSNTCKQKGWIDLHRNECVLSSPRLRAQSANKSKTLLTNEQQNQIQRINKEKPKTANLLSKRAKNNVYSGHFSLNPFYNEPENYSYN